MKLTLSNIDKTYIAALLVSIFSFVFPSIKMVIAGEEYTQFFIATYSGEVVFANLVFFGVILQALVFYKNQKWLPWIGFICGLYASFYAGNQVWKCLIRFQTTRTPTLVDKLRPECFPLAGVWLLLASGILLLIIATIKIIRRSLSEKNPAALTG